MAAEAEESQAGLLANIAQTEAALRIALSKSANGGAAGAEASAADAKASAADDASTAKAAAESALAKVRSLVTDWL